MKENIRKNDIIKWISLFFDLDIKAVKKNLKKYYITEDKIIITLVFPRKEKVIIYLLKRISDKDLIVNKNETKLIIVIKKENKKFITLKRKNKITIYNLDILTGYNYKQKEPLFFYPKKIRNLIMISLDLMKLEEDKDKT